MSALRSILPLVLLAAACGGKDAGDGGGGPGDGSGTGTGTGSTVDAAPAPYCTAKSGTNLKLVQIATGLRKPVGLAAPTGDGRIFILEQEGRIRLVKDGNLVATPYLDISDKVNAVGEEQGLLGLAFHPRFAENGKFYVFYTSDPYGDIIVAQYTATPSADTANATEKVILTEQRRQNQDNHNGGTVAFGPDGFLYISIGDGGAADNYLRNGQNTQSKKAKILRIDVDGGDPYAIPAGNPWAGGGGVPEMWAWGLRNPYRFSIDPLNGDLYIGDVGQGWYEEIDYAPGGQGGRNFGWAIFEGPDCFTADPDGNAGCSGGGGTTMPLVAIDRRGGEFSDEGAIVAGPVYRGTCMPDLTGQFFYGDYKAGKIRTLRVQNGQAMDRVDRTRDLDPNGSILGSTTGMASFGVDGYNEVYVMALMAGRVYRIEVE